MQSNYTWPSGLPLEYRKVHRVEQRRARVVMLQFEAINFKVEIHFAQGRRELYDLFPKEFVLKHSLGGSAAVRREIGNENMTPRDTAQFCNRPCSNLWIWKMMKQAKADDRVKM